MNRYHLLTDSFSDVTTVVDPRDPVSFLMSKWAKLPTGMSIFHRSVLAENDVTPSTESDIAYLRSLTGDIYLLQAAGEPVTIGLILLATVAVLAITAKKPSIITPTLRNVQSTSPNNELSNRENTARIGGRIPDIFGQVISTPDLISAPYFVYKNHTKYEYGDFCVGRGSYLISDAQPTIKEIRDGDTLIAQIEGAGVDVYEPNKSSNNSSPSLHIGDSIDRPMLVAKRVDAVNGQVLFAPNEDDVALSGEACFAKNGRLISNPASSVHLDDIITAGVVTVSSSPFIFGGGPTFEGTPYVWSALPAVYISDTTSIKVSMGNPTILAQPGNGVRLNGIIDGVAVNKVFLVTGTTTVYDLGDEHVLIALHDPSLLIPALDLPSGSYPFNWTGTFESVMIDFSGTYDVTTVSANSATLDDPISVNLGWYWDWGSNLPNNWSEVESSFYYQTSGILITGGTSTSDAINNWVGPFTVNLNGMNGVIANFIAMQGLYKDDGTTQIATNVQVDLELTPVSPGGVATGSIIKLSGTVLGSATDRTERALTVENSTTFPIAGQYSVRARRLTPKDLAYTGQVSDEIKWVDLYGTKPVTNAHFGNVTTIRAITSATTGALALKSRKLNLRVTRKLNILQNDNTLSSSLGDTRRFVDALISLCLDPFIGRRSLTELDLNNFRVTFNTINTYFGSPAAALFNYTFDKADTSFEEMVEIVCGACYSTAYRVSRTIKIAFENRNSLPKVLFNHRNKLPQTEVRSEYFGSENDFDGIEASYVDASDGSIVTFYYPTDMSATNPKKVTLIGVAHRLQAYFHVMRFWNKLQYQNMVVEFDATREAETLIRNDVIMVADNTIQSVQDGEVVGIEGSTILTSQPVNFVVGKTYTVFIQSIDGSIESIDCVPGDTPYRIQLTSLPTKTFSVSDFNASRATYLLTCEDDEAVVRDFMVQERSSDEKFVNTLVATNYDVRYYENDDDYVNGDVDSNGFPV